jgi:hypothetical protein
LPIQSQVANVAKTYLFTCHCRYLTLDKRQKNIRKEKKSKPTLSLSASTPTELRIFSMLFASTGFPKKHQSMYGTVLFFTDKNGMPKIKTTARYFKLVIGFRVSDEFERWFIPNPGLKKKFMVKLKIYG